MADPMTTADFIGMAFFGGLTVAIIVAWAVVVWRDYCFERDHIRRLLKIFGVPRG